MSFSILVLFKIVKYDKGNGICIMSSHDYLDKLNVIVDDTTKFKLLEKDHRKNTRNLLIFTIILMTL